MTPITVSSDLQGKLGHDVLTKDGLVDADMSLWIGC